MNPLYRQLVAVVTFILLVVLCNFYIFGEDKKKKLNWLENYELSRDGPLWNEDVITPNVDEDGNSDDTSEAPTRLSKNPLYNGIVEDDIPVDDSYFQHNGELSSFIAMYVEYQREVLEKDPNRVVVYIPMKETGLGNSLLALVSGFVYAALTKRAFQVNYCEFSSHYLFPFQNSISNYTFNRHPFSSFSVWNRHYSYMQPTDKSMRKLPPRFYSRKPGVLITGFMPFLQFIIRHDHYIEKLMAMGFLSEYNLRDIRDMQSSALEGYYSSLSSTVIEKVLSTLLKPQPRIKALVNKVLSPYTDKTFIGFHIRMGNSASSFKDSHVFLHMHDIEHFEDAALQYIKQRNETLNDTRWIVCTDSDRVEEELRKKYGSIIVTSSSYKRGHSKAGAKDTEGFTRAVIDLELLRRCNHLILTSHSTYSVIARMNRGKNVSFIMMNSKGYF